MAQIGQQIIGDFHRRRDVNRGGITSLLDWPLFTSSLG
jgi:hypothetical protein